MCNDLPESLDDDDELLPDDELELELDEDELDKLTVDVETFLSARLRSLLRCPLVLSFGTTPGVGEAATEDDADEDDEEDEDDVLRVLDIFAGFSGFSDFSDFSSGTAAAGH